MDVLEGQKFSPRVYEGGLEERVGIGGSAETPKIPATNCDTDLEFALQGAIAVDRLNHDDFMAPVWRKLQALEKSCSLATFKPPRKIKVQTKGGSSFGCSFLRVVGFLSCLHVVGASPASAPGSSTYVLPSTSPTFFYVGVAATIIGTAIAVISLGVSIYFRRRERGDGVRGVLDVLLRPFRVRGVYMAVGSLEVGEARVNGLIFDSR